VIRKTFLLILCLFFSFLILAGCAKSHQGLGEKWHLVVIGDYSMKGLGEAYAAQIEKDVGVKVVVEDYIMQNLSVGDVLNELQLGKSNLDELSNLRTALSDAEVVVLYVDPTDSIGSVNPLNMDGCFVNSPPTNCTLESFGKYTTDLKAIWDEIFKLRKGQPIILKAMNAYNPYIGIWEPGERIFGACTKCWWNMSKAVRLVAESYNIQFVDRYILYNGGYLYEDPREKGYVESDSLYPTSLGQQVVAKLLSGYIPVPPP
jgi:hypothetical protein